VILFIKSMVSGYRRRDGVRVAAYERADAFASRAHAGQYRKGPGHVPYVQHPRAVAAILRDEAGITDRETLIAALLHDTIEDTGTSHGELVRLFGQVVADTVAELTNEVKPADGKTASQIRHAGKMSARAAHIKVADKTANMRDIINIPPPWTSARKRQYYDDARAVVAAMPTRHAKLDELFNRIYLTGINKI
jgi:guanosine-3',5'-bis(diphosphate) 3'-pyrophosphohydrolase